MLKRVARTLEGGIPEGPTWHRQLLEGAGLEIERIRPPVLSADVLVVAHEPRRFRHLL